MNKKDIVIISLVIVILVLTIFTVFSTMNKRVFNETSQFLENTQKIQDDISFYVGTMYANTFEIYENEEILTGKISNTQEQIKDNEDKELIPIVDEEIKVEKDGKISYQINKKNLESVLSIKIPEYEGISWYIQDGTTLRVKLDNTPKWWSSELDFLKV